MRDIEDPKQKKVCDHALLYQVNKMFQVMLAISMRVFFCDCERHFPHSEHESIFLVVVKVLNYMTQQHNVVSVANKKCPSQKKHMSLLQRNFKIRHRCDKPPKMLRVALAESVRVYFFKGFRKSTHMQQYINSGLQSPKNMMLGF